MTATLLLGQPPFALPSDCISVQKSMEDFKSLELSQKVFFSAIICPKEKDTNALYDIICYLYRDLSIKNLFLETSRIEKDLILKLMESCAGLKLFSPARPLDFKRLLPNPTQRNKFNLNKLYPETLSALHRAFSMSAIEGGLVQVLGDSMEIELVRILFSPHSERFLEQISKTNKAFYLIDNEFLSGQKFQLIFLRKHLQPFRTQEVKFLSKIANAAFLSIKRILRLEHLETLEQHWTATFNAFDAAIGVLSKEGQIIKINRTFEKHFGKPPYDLKKVISQWCWPPNRTEKKFSFNDKTYDLHFHPYNQGWIVVLHDVSDKEKLERQILESSKMAELGMISSSIAHEINNPLGGILSYLQLILMDLPKEHPQYEDIKEMESATQKCKNIVQNLLGFARKEDGEQKTLVSLVEVIQEALELCQFPVKYNGIEIQKNFEIRDAKIKGHRNNLVQAIKNIIQNAIEATHDRPGHIAVSLISLDNKFQLLISDKGEGIAPHNLHKIYNPLFSTKKSQNHPGLGLTVAFQIVQEHGGSLEILSQPKGGTKAIISFQRPDLKG